MMKKLLCAVSLFLSTQSVLAETVTIDFESTAHTGHVANAFDHEEEGYLVSGFFTVWGSTPSNSAPNYTGSAAFTRFSNFPNALTTITRIDSQAFNVASIDLARFRTDIDNSPINLTFFGLLSNGNSIDQTFTYTGGSSTNGIETFYFNNFNDLASLSFYTQLTLNKLQFDNIVVSKYEVSAVPAPAALWLFAAGLPLIAFKIRRKES